MVGTGADAIRDLQAAGMERSIKRAQDANEPCVFCPENWHNLQIVARPYKWVAIIKPLDPVTDGHVLVIHRLHTKNAAEDSAIASELMEVAADWVKGSCLNANIITSIGALATQTVQHTHLHVVPRRYNDGLPLPWTPQQHAERYGSGPHLLTAKDGSQALCGGPGVCGACTKTIDEGRDLT